MKRWLSYSCASLFCLPMLVQASGNWLPVKDISLVIEAGSILDFSSLNRLGGAANARLIVNQDGHIACADTPRQALRFMMGSLGFGVPSGGFPSHSMADLYARQFRMHGYNMARLDFVEETLMTDRPADFDFNPEQLDRLHYLLFALKREGIYYMLNGLSSGNGAYGNIQQRWNHQREVQLGLYYDPVRQQHWKTLMEKLFVPVNPYTGVSGIDEPALAGLIMVNEGGLAFTNRQRVSDHLRPQFALWLKNKYGSNTALAAAWKSELMPGETLEAQTVNFPAPASGNSQRMADTQRFFVDLEKTTADWMIQHLRQLGYKGMLTAYNNWLSPAAQISRGQFAWVDMHNYFAEPSNGIAPGSVLRQDSLLQGAAGYIRDLAAARHLGKAFTVSEFGQVFWNKYRREGGLAIGAYAAFQGWDVIGQHAHAISLSYESGKPGKDIIGPFNVAPDPVARAGETLAALLYLRGDVAPAQHLAGITLSPKFVFEENPHLGGMPSDLSRLALVTGIGLDWQGKMPAKYDVQLSPGNNRWLFPPKQSTPLARLQSIRPNVTAKVTPKVGALADTWPPSKSSAKSSSKSAFLMDEGWTARVDALRKNALIDTQNLTDAAAGIYQSDTGQILLDSQHRRMTVITPYTEAMVFDTAEPVRLDNLQMQQADGPALISVSSMDGQPLHDSKRMLLILATDARNSGMRFSDAAQTRLLDVGGKPVLIESAIVKLRLKNKYPAQLKLYSTTLRGIRGDLIAVTQELDGISFVIDSAKLSHGPSTYFEITSQD
jgi:hypothetical protein